MAATAVAPAAVVSACAQPTGPSGVLPSNWLTPGVLISAPSAISEPTAVPTTSGLRESISVCPSWVLTSATRATVDARRCLPVTLASAQAAVAAPAVAVPRTATVRHNAASSGPLPAPAARRRPPPPRARPPPGGRLRRGGGWGGRR